MKRGTLGWMSRQVAQRSGNSRRSIWSLRTCGRTHSSRPRITESSLSYHFFRVGPELAEKLPSKVTEHEVAEWAARHHANWSPTKHNAAIGSLKGVFKVAIDRGIIGTNPAAKLTQKRLELASSGQVKQVVKTARESGASSAEGNGDLIEFLAYSGCRIKEAGRVRWKDVDESTRRIWIEPGNSGHGRHVPINPAMADLLKRIRGGKRWILASPKRKEHVLINISCRLSIEAACVKAGVQRMTHHSQPERWSRALQFRPLHVGSGIRTGERYCL